MSHQLAIVTANVERPQFTIATLVNDESQYAKMLCSFSKGGFTPENTEFIAIRKATSAYAGLNAAIAAANGYYIVLCHQDVRLLADDSRTLAARLGSLTRLDSAWGLAGNAGGRSPGNLAMRITDPHGENRTFGPLPARVMSLDENFIVVRRDAGVRFSRDLTGFHLYGSDICLVAEIMGWSAWVIDFHIEHLSPGRKDATFAASEKAFRRKWSRALRGRWLQTTCTLLRVSGTTWGRSLGVLAERPFRAVLRRAPLVRRLVAARTPSKH